MRSICLLLCALPTGLFASEPDKVPPAALPTVICANAEGILDVAGFLRTQAFDAIPNPFRDRSRPPPQIREVPLVIGSVLIAGRDADASAVINGQVYSPGDVIEGMTLSAIGGECLELRGENILLRLPVGDAPLRLRLDR